MKLWQTTLAPFVALLTSAGTLLCCALPALLVSLGMGAVVAGMASAVPQLVWLSEHKLWVFVVAGLLLVGALGLTWHARKLPCPADPKQAKLCSRLRLVSYWVLGTTIALYGIGFFFAFIASKVLF